MIHTYEDLTPRKLTQLLREAQQLPRGQVDWVEFQVLKQPFGSPHPLFHLVVQYKGTAGNSPPARFFLKFGSSCKEAFFYNSIGSRLSIPPLLRCYYAGYDPQADTSCLLLEDLSQTHFQSEYPLPPPVSLCKQSVEALAEIHARFWEHPSLERDLRPALPPGRAWNDRVTLAIKKLAAFLDFIGDRLAPHHRTLYEHLISCSSAPWMNLPGSPNQTLLHGDLHFWNLLFPIHGYNEHLRIFDWNMWDIGRPTGDLAYLLALHWSPERRARLESPLLNDYHRRLNACGIDNYSMDTFLLDYRISVIQTLFIPIWQWNKGISPTIWWSHLERGLQAFEGLECAELI